MKSRGLAVFGLLTLGACAFDFAGYDPHDLGASASGGGGVVCAPGEPISCYEGADGTEGVGACRAGQAICAADGSGFGPCEGAVEPEPERCDTTEDDDCDGTALDSDAGCVCTPGTKGPCYEGPPGTLDVGICGPGVGSCNPSGTAVEGQCLGQTLPVGESCASALDESCDGVANDWCGSWHARYFGAWSQRPLAMDITPGFVGLGGDFGGNTAPAGLTFDLGGPDLTNAGKYDAFVGMVSDDGGAHVWSRSFGGVESDAVTAVAFDESGNLYAAAFFVGSMVLDGVTVATSSPTDRDAVVLKLDGATGTTEWSVVLSGPGLAEATSIDVRGGKVLVVGSFDTSVVLDPPALTAANDATDAFVVALDAASGEHLWHQVLGAVGVDIARSVDIGADGEVLVGGEWDEIIDLGPLSLPDAVSQGAFIERLSPDGTPLLLQGFDSSGNDRINAVRQGADGSIYVAGSAGAGIDLGAGAIPTLDRDGFVAHFLDDGSLVWADLVAVAGTQEAVALDVDADGRVVAGLWMRNHAIIDDLLYPASPSDTWLVTLYDASGERITTRLFGDHDDQDIRHTLFHQGGVLAAGDCDGEMSFGDGPPTHHDSESVCLAKLDP